MCSIPRTILDASFFELFANIICDPLVGNCILQPVVTWLKTVPRSSTTSQIYTLQHIFSLSHFSATYFLIFSSLMENVPKSSKTFCIIPYHLHKSPNLIFQNIFLQQKLWNLEDFVSKSTWNAKYVNDDCLKPGICLLHLQANVMHSGRSGIYLNEYRGMTSSKSMVDIRS